MDFGVASGSLAPAVFIEQDGQPHARQSGPSVGNASSERGVLATIRADDIVLMGTHWFGVRDQTPHTRSW